MREDKILCKLTERSKSCNQSFLNLSLIRDEKTRNCECASKLLHNVLSQTNGHSQ